jgi:hypothetical protein
MYLIVYALLCLLVSELSSSQECKSSCDLHLSTCTFVDYPIYYDGDLNVTANEHQAAVILQAVQAYSTILPQDCITAITEYTCGVLYPACNTETVTPIKPCLQMCVRVHTACNSVIPLLSPSEQAFIDCDQLGVDGSPLFTNDTECYSLNNTTPVCNSSSPIPQIVSGCQLYDPTLSPLTGNACAPFVSSEIYVENAADANIQTLLDSIANSSGIYLAEKLNMIIPFGCYKHILSLICQTTFPTCERVEIEDGRLVEVGATPCYESCLDMLAQCSSFFSSSDASSMINCSSVSPITGLPLWPPGPTFSTSLPDQNATNVQVTCSTFLFPPNTTRGFSFPEVETCPTFLTKAIGRTDADRLCWVPCPDPSYSDKMWDDLVVLMLVVSSISISLMAFLLLSSILMLEHRKRHIHNCIYISVMLMNISFLLGGRNPQKTVWCTDPTSYSTSKTNSVCELQGNTFESI